MDQNCTLEEARAAKALAQQAFSRLGKVAGVGITRVGAGYGLKINLYDVPPGNAALPDKVGGVPVRVEVVGRIK